MKNKLNDGLPSYKLMLSVLFLALMTQSSFVYAENKDVAKAKKQEPLTITLTATKVVKSNDGKEVFSSADKVKPGDVVEYKAKYANVSKASLSSVNAILPIPKGMEYIDRTANPATVMATADDLKYEVAPLKRKVKDKTGKEVTTLVPVSEYRSLKWTLGDLPAGKVVTVSARVHVAK